MQDGSTRRATIYDVARVAGVSHQTVSRLVKGELNIRADLRERIEQALTELNYRPNEAARTLTTKRSRVIGALVYDISEMGPSFIIQGASERAREFGYVLEIVTVASQDATGADESIDLLSARDFAGVIVVTPSDRLSARVFAQRLTLPVHIAHAADEDDENSINKRGVAMLVEHLVELGHSKFWLISGPASSDPARNRANAFTATLSAHGLTAVGISEGDWSARSGFEEASRFADSDFTALVCANDQMALGAMLALEEHGKDVPGDVSVVGFDDIPEARFFRPPLTTIAQDMKQQGRLAVDALLARSEPELALPPLHPVRPILRLRGSTAPPPAPQA